MDRQTIDLLTRSVREMLADTPPGAGLREPLAELGWDEVLADDAAAATTILFGEHGRALTTTRALDEVVLGEIEQVLPPASGVRAVVHPHPSAVDPRDCAPAATPLPPAGRPVRGVVLSALGGIDELVVPVAGGAGPGVVVVPVGAVEAAPVDAFDRAVAWTEARCDAPAHAVADLGQRWTSAVAAARRALAAEIIGACRGMLKLAVEHTSGRVQFGRPIASFQAVRHRLAEAHAELEGCAGLLDAAWIDGGAWSAAVAKQSAGHLQCSAARHALQVSGALGLSEEHALHRYVARGAVLDALYLPHQQLDAQLGRELLAPAAVGRPLARLVEL